MSCGSLDVTRINASCVTLMNESWVTLIVRNPHKFSYGFLYWVVSKPKTPRKKPSLKNKPDFSKRLGLFFGGGPLPPGSWFGNYPLKKPVRNPGGVLIQKNGVVFQWGSFSSGSLVWKPPNKETRKKPRGVS